MPTHRLDDPRRGELPTGHVAAAAGQSTVRRGVTAQNTERAVLAVLAGEPPATAAARIAMTVTDLTDAIALYQAAGRTALDAHTARDNWYQVHVEFAHPAVKRIRKRLAEEMRTLRGANATAVIARLNPIIRGWACYYRTVVSGKVFNALDNYVWNLTYRWALRQHRNKPKTWVVDRYYGTFNTTRKDRWVFGDRDSGAYLIKFSWIPIARHNQVKGTASPDDPALADYWSHRRRRRKPPPLDRPTLRLLKAQGGRCPLCGDYLLHADHEPQSPEEWELWFIATRKALRRQALTLHSETRDQHHHLIHIHCHRRHQAEKAPTRQVPRDRLRDASPMATECP